MTRPVALVTGASAGIGEEFARQVAARGHDLVLVARDRARLEALAKELADVHGANAVVFPADLTDPQQLAEVEARARTVDMLVNNAGFGTFGTFHELDLEAEVREVQLNVVALIRLTHAAAGPMAARGNGSILNVSSLAGFQAAPMNATYSATKAFVTSFTEAVHEEMKGKGVSVSVLCPGFTRTEFQERAERARERCPRLHVAGRSRGCGRGARRPRQEQGDHRPRLVEPGAGHILEHGAPRGDAPRRGGRPQAIDALAVADREKPFGRGVDGSGYWPTKRLVSGGGETGDRAVACDRVHLALRVLAE